MSTICGSLHLQSATGYPSSPKTTISAQSKASPASPSSECERGQLTSRVCEFPNLHARRLPALRGLAVPVVGGLAALAQHDVRRWGSGPELEQVAVDLRLVLG